MTRWLTDERVAELQAAARKRGARASPAIKSRQDEQDDKNRRLSALVAAMPMASPAIARRPATPANPTPPQTPSNSPLRDFALRLPWPPTVNHSTRPTASGGRILTAQHKEFRAQVAQVWADHRERTNGPVIGRLEVDVVLFPPNRRAFDLDNRLKSLLDAMQHAGVFADDGAIDKLSIRRSIVEAGQPTGDAVVTIRTLP
jgi:crossover junction endodeoxyribonuclease RusA